MSKSGQTFNFHAAVETVYAPAGDMILNEKSGPADLAQQVDDLRSQIQTLAEIDAATRAAVDAALRTAVEDGNGATVQKHLTTAATTLESAAGAAEKGLKLARTLTEMGKWAAAILP